MITPEKQVHRTIMLCYQLQHRSIFVLPLSKCASASTLRANMKATLFLHWQHKTAVKVSHAVC